MSAKDKDQINYGTICDCFDLLMPGLEDAYVHLLRRCNSTQCHLNESNIAKQANSFL